MSRLADIHARMQNVAAVQADELPTHYARDVAYLLTLLQYDATAGGNGVRVPGSDQLFYAACADCAERVRKADGLWAIAPADGEQFARRPCQNCLKMNAAK